MITFMTTAGISKKVQKLFFLTHTRDRLYFKSITEYRQNDLKG